MTDHEPILAESNQWCNNDQDWIVQTARLVAGK